MAHRKSLRDDPYRARRPFSVPNMMNDLSSGALRIQRPPSRKRNQPKRHNYRTPSNGIGVGY